MKAVKRFRLSLILILLIATPIALYALSTHRVYKPLIMPGFEISTMRWQQDSPAQVVSTITSPKRFLSVVVLNTANAPLREVQIGWLIKGDDDKPIQVFTAKPQPVFVDRGKVEAILLQEWTTPEVLQYAKGKGLEHFHVQVGIVGAKLQSGENFTFDPIAAGGFLQEKDNPAITELYTKMDSTHLHEVVKKTQQKVSDEAEGTSSIKATNPVGNSFMQPASFKVKSLFGGTRAALASGQQYYCCKNDAAWHTSCSVVGSSCGTTQCNIGLIICPGSSGSNCACQKCGIVPDCGGSWE
jgi:hypothetical protein